MTTAADYRDVALHLIREPEHRLRETIDVERLGELADSIAAEGLHQPIGVRGPEPDGRFEIVWGHRRFLAVQLLRRPSIPAHVFPPDYDPLLAAISENEQREDLAPMDQARAVQALYNKTGTVAATARLMRRSAAWVSGRLELLGLPPDIQAAVQDRIIPIGVGRVLADVDHDEYRRSLIREAQRTGASQNVVEVWRQHFLADRERLVSNMLTIQEIASRRESWKILVPCDWCRTDTDYTHTRAPRVCLECLAAVEGLMAAEALKVSQAGA